jgi:hypothetical protein
VRSCKCGKGIPNFIKGRDLFDFLTTISILRRSLLSAVSYHLPHTLHCLLLVFKKSAIFIKYEHWSPCSIPSIYLFMSPQPFVVILPLFSFLILYIVGMTPWMRDQPFAKPPPIYRTTQTENKSTQTFMARVGFETTIPVFERAKTFHALDHASTVIGFHTVSKWKIFWTNTVQTTPS